jgi:hypothetical protein
MPLGIGMFGSPSTVDSIAHVIQVALTPVFLLTGIASLLGVFSGRLARVGDQLDSLSEKMDVATAAELPRLRRHLNYLRRRSYALDAAVVLGGLAGVATSVAALLLFVSTLREHTGANYMFAAFGSALVFTIGALAFFLCEMLMASRGIRLAVEDTESSEFKG